MNIPLQLFNGFKTWRIAMYLGEEACSDNLSELCASVQGNSKAKLTLTVFYGRL